MCEQCCAKTLDFGEVFPGWNLIQATQDGNFMKKGDYGLLQYNDPDVYWSKRPIKDITFDLNDEQIEKLYEDPDYDFIFDNFFEVCDELEEKLNIFFSKGYSLYKAIIDSGYVPDIHGHRITCYIVHKMAVLLENNEEIVLRERDFSKIYPQNFGILENGAGI